MIDKIVKRDNSVELFEVKKISDAIYKAMQAVDNGTQENADSIAHHILEILEEKKRNDDGYVFTIEEVQDTVEEQLMLSDFHNAAKAYILYRYEQTKKRKRNVFEKRLHLKPYEYPELLEYVDAIRHSYWIHTEFNFTGDIQDFKTTLTEIEKSAVKKTMLAISQIEVAVKTFWGDLYHKIPKPEIGAVGATFAESEVRHHDAYSHLLEVLGFNDEFKNLKKNPTIMKRMHYLETALKNAKSENIQEYTQSILLFSLFIEHVSLFSQFLIIMSFNKHQNNLKGISNVVEATSKEEQIHGNFGVELINIIKSENEEWFDDEHTDMVTELCKKAYEAESEVIDWIFEEGELDFLPKNVVKEFIKDRFNNSLGSIGIPKIFEVDPILLEESEWFDDEIIGTKHGDFFVKRSINYNKRSKSITSDDLF